MSIIGNGFASSRKLRSSDFLPDYWQSPDESELTKEQIKWKEEMEELDRSYAECPYITLTRTELALMSAPAVIWTTLVAFIFFLR